MPHRVRAVAVKLNRSVGGVTLAGFTPPPAGVMPTIQNTGIPLGASAPTSTFGYFSEGLTDARTVETLVVASSTSVPGWTAPDANGIAYLPNTATNQTYDHIDFTNLVIIVPSAVLSVTFTKCKFATTNSALALQRAQGAFLIQIAAAATAVNFADCNLDGSTTNVNYAVQTPLSMPNGNTSTAGVTYLRNNIRGFSTLLSVGAWTTFLFDSNYCHDAVIDKHNDAASGFTNSANWAHCDGFQIGATNTVGTGRVQNNTLIAFSATNQIATGPLQVGQMAGPAPAHITSFVFDSNWLDGGSYVVGANLGTAITVDTRFEVTNNKVGLNWTYGIDSGNTVHSFATLWAGNTYIKTGTAGNVGGMGTAGAQYQVSVTAGQSIP